MYPTLNSNEIYAALYNQIISQELFDRISDSSELVDNARVDGSLYGDTKTYFAADALFSNEWGNDAEAANLLALDRPDAPETDTIVLDVFRQIRLTLDDYLSKRAWSNEFTFGQFNSLMEGMIGKTKRIYDVATYNCFACTEEVEAQNRTVAAGDEPEMEGKLIAEDLANLLVELKDYSRKFNEYGHITKFGESEIKVVWNSAAVNKIKKVDLPQIFHKEGLVDKFEQYVVPAKYFGTKVGAIDAAQNDGTYQALKEAMYGKEHVFPGEFIPKGVDIADGMAYKADDTILYKIYVKLPPYMSAFEVGTTFFNPRSLTTNRYLTFGHNTLKHLMAFPVITVRKSK